MPNDPPEKHCSVCLTPQSLLPHPLKNCAKCHTGTYCSRVCQKANWKAHKRTCATGSMPTSGAVLLASIPVLPGRPLHLTARPDSAANRVLWQKLVDGTFLHGISEDDVFGNLIDSYRLRVTDELDFAGVRKDVDAVTGSFIGLPGLQGYLDRVEEKDGGRWMPRWWDRERRAKCEGLAGEAGSWYSVHRGVKKQDIIDRYGDPLRPMALRIFAEVVEGWSMCGQDGMSVARVGAGLGRDGLMGSNGWVVR